MQETECRKQNTEFVQLVQSFMFHGGMFVTTGKQEKANVEGKVRQSCQSSACYRK